MKSPSKPLASFKIKQFHSLQEKVTLKIELVSDTEIFSPFPKEKVYNIKSFRSSKS